MALQDLKDKLNDPKGQEIWGQLSRQEKNQLIKQYVPDYGNYKTKDRFEFMDHLDNFAANKTPSGFPEPQEEAKTGGATPIAGPITNAILGAVAGSSPILKPATEAIGGALGSFASKVKSALGTTGSEAEENLVENVLAKKGLKDIAPDHPEDTESLRGITKWANQKLDQLKKIEPEGRKFLAEPEEAHVPGMMDLKKSQSILSGADDLLKNKVNPNSATGKLLVSVMNKVREYQSSIDPEIAAAREATRVGYQEVDPARKALLGTLGNVKDTALKYGTPALIGTTGYGLLKKLGVM